MAKWRVVQKKPKYWLAALKMLLMTVILSISSGSIAQDSRPVVGIAQMEDLSGTGEADSFSAMIETVLIGTGKFRIIERRLIARLIEERNLAFGGLVQSRTPERIGGFEGVDYLIYGTLVELRHGMLAAANNGLNNGATETPQTNLTGCLQHIVQLEADIRITDATTGEIRVAERLSVTANAPTICGEGAAATNALRSAADQIASGLATTVFPIQVAFVQPDGQIILNYGEGTLRIGELHAVYGRSYGIPDPGSGGMIQVDGALLGTIRITDVQDRFSRAVPVAAFGTTPPVGSIVRHIDQ